MQIRHIKIPTQNGQWVVADLFKPRTATAENPAPFIVVVPGFQRSKESLSNISLELARRGFVVASIDPYAQGSSSASLSRRAATTEGYGMFAVVDYAASSSNLNYIDKIRIGATGHSAGGNAAIRGANYFGRESQETGRPSKLHSVFVSGYVLTLTDEVLNDVRSNVGMSYAFYDEGAYRNELGTGDMRSAPEALRLVNHGLASEGRSVDKVILGEYYGDVDTRTLRVVHNERVLHPFQPLRGIRSGIGRKSSVSSPWPHPSWHWFHSVRYSSGSLSSGRWCILSPTPFPSHREEAAPCSGARLPWVPWWLASPISPWPSSHKASSSPPPAGR